jgi:integrase
MKLTKDAVAKLKLAGEVDRIWFDDKVTGFGVRLRAGGKRTWVIQYRVGRKTRRFTLADVEKLSAERAREEAKTRLAQVTLGGDPKADLDVKRQKAQNDLGSVVELYLTAREPGLRPKSVAESRRYLRVYWKPLHHMPVHEVARRDVAARFTRITADHGPVPASRARAYLSALMSWAMREGLVEANPVIGTNKPPEPAARDRVLTDEELAAVWAACRDDDLGRIVKLLILTGSRREEIAGLQWSELDLEGAVINLPGERTKNGKAHTVPLSGPALDILKACPQRPGRELVFGDGAGGYQGWGKAKISLDKRIKPSLAPWRIHDLRRTVATVMAESPPDKDHPKARGLGVAPHVVEAMLNHVSGHKAGVAGVYNRASYGREVRAALVMWADHVQSITGGGERQVVSIPQGRIKGWKSRV